MKFGVKQEHDNGDKKLARHANPKNRLMS